MPNIEIYGFSNPYETDEILRLANVRRIIEEQIQSLGLENEDVVTVVFDSVVSSYNRKRASMPFIRVCSTEKEKIEQIVKAFKKAKIGLDVETLILNSFIPKDEME